MENEEKADVLEGTRAKTINIQKGLWISLGFVCLVSAVSILVAFTYKQTGSYNFHFAGPT